MIPVLIVAFLFAATFHVERRVDRLTPDPEVVVDANAFQPPQPAGAFNTNASQCDDPNLAAYDTVTSGDYVVRDRAVRP